MQQRPEPIRTVSRIVRRIALMRAPIYDRRSSRLNTALSVSWMAEIPTDADQIAAMDPKVSFPEDAAAVVSLNVLSTVPRADVGITRARYSRSRSENRCAERATKP